MRPTLLLALAAVSAVLALGPPIAAAQETEAPSSRPLPSPGAPAPPLAAPQDSAAPGAAPTPDRSAADAAVRAQCTADRARFCREASGVGALACLSGNFAKLTPDCQSAVTALKQARMERSGGG